MLPVHRPQLIQDLSDAALGLIEEAEGHEAQEARALIELAGTLDKLRVELLSKTGMAPQLSSPTAWKHESHH